MKIQLLYAPSKTDALNILYSACRQCYYSGFVGDCYPYEDVTLEKKRDLLLKVINSGHTSVLEHVSFVFAIGGISRASAQQLTRHRMASYSMQSMRYCDVQSSGMEIPESINDTNLLLCNEYVDTSVKIYNQLIENGVPREDARGVLPINWKSNIVMTMNCRELLHFFSERLCKQAQKEIRDLAKYMLDICNSKLPEVFKYAGPKCKINGYCNEGKRSCHMYPLKEDVLDFYNKNKKNVHCED